MADSVDTARDRLLERLGLDRAPARFDEALTHPSWANEHKALGAKDNQRLEFLGDGVLDLCVSEIVLDRMPEADEGALTRAYHALVNTEALASWARLNGVGAALRLGRGAIADGSADRANVLADALEAVVAAVYLDSGLEAARKVSARIVGDAIANIGELVARDPKSQLQESVQAEGAPPPSYRVLSVEGPDNARTFVIGVEIGGVLVAEGRGRSKKLAEQAAAATALAQRAAESAVSTEAMPESPR
jgi:ribonuclease-3